MSSILIDDHNTLTFSSGTWYQELNYAGAFHRTRSLTRETGAFRTVRFIGTSIIVHGGLQALESDGDNPLKVQFFIDNVASMVYAPQMPKRFYTNATYYESPTLSMGEHVLVIQNLVDWDSLWIDYFEIGTSSGGTAEMLQSDGSFLPVAQSPSPVSESSTSTLSSTTSLLTSGSESQTVTLTITPSTTSSRTSSSSSQTTPLSSTFSSSHANISRDVYSTPATSPAPMTTYQTTVINSQNQLSNSHVKTPIIISASCAGAAVTVALVVVLVVLRKRRRKQKRIQVLSDPYTRSMLQYTSRLSPDNNIALTSSEESNNISTTSLATSGSSTLDIPLPPLQPVRLHISDERPSTLPPYSKTCA